MKLLAPITLTFIIYDVILDIYIDPMMYQKLRWRFVGQGRPTEYIENDTQACFCYCNIYRDSMTAIYEFDVDILKIYLGAKNKLSSSGRSTVLTLHNVHKDGTHAYRCNSKACL